METAKSPEAFTPAPIMRRREPHSRHGGGAWKVAYADFVTALMALFIVLWILNGSTKVKQSVQGYFRDPRGYAKALGGGPFSSGAGLQVNQHTVHDLQREIEAALHQMPEFQNIRNNVLLSVTGEGLRIDLLEREQGTFFVSGASAPTEAGSHLLRMLAEELGRMPNQVVIEGHTDARPFRNTVPTSPYTNWELACDRANSARRLLYGFGLPADRVVEVRGFADHWLLNPEDPADPRNRRVSVVVKFHDATTNDQ